MRIQLEHYQAAFSALPCSVREAEICSDLREEVLVQVRGGEQTGGESFSRTTQYLRASGQKTGTILSERLDEDPYQLMARALGGRSTPRQKAWSPLTRGSPAPS